MRYKELILKIINESENHLTAEDIFFALKKEYQKVVLATVYNNINALYESGLIRKVIIEGQPDRYDKNTVHDHLVCSRCGKISDIHISDLTESLESQLGFHISGYDLKVNYLCEDCRKLNKNK